MKSKQSFLVQFPLVCIYIFIKSASRFVSKKNCVRMNWAVMEVQQKLQSSGDYEAPQTLANKYANVNVVSKSLIEDVHIELEPSFRKTSSNSTLSAVNQPTHTTELNVNQNSIARQMQDLCHALRHDAFVTDVKLLMFVAAANYDAYRSTLVPIPPIFMTDTFYDIEKLRATVATWPSCSQMLKALRSFDNQGYRLFRNLGADNINLLHWVLVMQAGPMIRRFGVRYLTKICQKLHMELPTTIPSEMLRVRYRSEPGAVKSKRHHVYFACPLNMLYRLLMMGDMDINWADSLRVHHQLEPALAQCDRISNEESTKCWPHSRFGRFPRCITICELLESAQQAPIPEDFIIENAACLRVRYLLFFGEHPEPKACTASIANTENVSNDPIFDDEMSPISMHCGLMGLARRIYVSAKKLVLS